MNGGISNRKIVFISLLGGLCLAVVLGCGFGRFTRTCQEVTQDTLRLHVRAADDSFAQQLLKLHVRDAVLNCVGPLLQNAADRTQAQQLVGAALPQIQLTAARAARKGGQTATVYLTQERFTHTAYSGFTLPGGSYPALRVDVGRAEGRNWFCVLYPALCLSAGQARYARADENAVVFGHYELRLAALDWVNGLRDSQGTKAIPAA